MANTNALKLDQTSGNICLMWSLQSLQLLAGQAPHRGGKKPLKKSLSWKRNSIEYSDKLTKRSFPAEAKAVWFSLAFKSHPH